jgi:hypothetical protein
MVSGKTRIAVSHLDKAGQHYRTPHQYSILESNTKHSDVPIGIGNCDASVKQSKTAIALNLEATAAVKTLFYSDTFSM